MSLTIPDNAPFTGAQRYWLKGYLDGINSTLQGPADGVPPVAEPGQPVTIAWGSQTGNAEALAKKLCKKLSKAGMSPSLRDMADLPVADLPGAGNLLVITSTYGEGEPPENARTLYKQLHAEDAPELGSVRYSVLALGDSGHEEFCKCGHDFDRQLSNLGARSLVPLVTCDVEVDEPYESWSNQLLEVISAA